MINDHSASGVETQYKVGEIRDERERGKKSGLTLIIIPDLLSSSLSGQEV